MIGRTGLLIAAWILAITLPAAQAEAQTSPAERRSASAFERAPDDPAAITVRAVGDGVADDSDALQRAIDSAAAKPGGGIVFLPSGRYRITRTLFMWPGVRLFGTGRSRPVFHLAPSTPGFQRGVGSMIFFTGNQPGGAAPGPGGTAMRGPVPVPPPTSVPFRADIADANSGTFYSAMANVDFEIGEGNPAATAVRFHTALKA